MFKLFKTQEATPTTTATATTVTEGMTLEQVRLAMLKLLAEERSNHYRMGELYNYVVNQQLAEKAGYKDARTWFGQHLAELSQATLTTYGAVAAAFSEPVTRRFGVTCLYLLLIYQEAADVELHHEEPGTTPIEVPDDNGQVTTQPFSACSVEHMRRALRRKRKPSSSKPLPAEAAVLASQYREALTSLFPKGVLVTVQARNQKGKAVLDFKGIPVEQVATLAAALSSELPPASAVPLLEKVLTQA